MTGTFAGYVCDDDGCRWFHVEVTGITYVGDDWVIAYHNPDDPLRNGQVRIAAGGDDVVRLWQGMAAVSPAPN